MTKSVLVLLMCISFSVASNAQRVVCDETCKIEFQHPSGEMDSAQTAITNEVNYAVVSPVGRSTVKMIDMAPRLSSLDGKTIAVVGGSFMASITHPEIKKLILENYPTAKVLVLDEIGSAGVYPAPGITRRNKDEFQKKLLEAGVDAVISGNCGCGLCTPKEVGSCIAAEYVGVPAVAIAAPGFVKEVYYTSINNGVPAPRVAEYPGAFTTHTREELIKNTREILWNQIVDGLTKPITEEEIEANATREKGDVRDDVFYGTIQEINEHFREMKWSDGLPIVPPTYDAVNEFLKYTDQNWNETVAVLPVAHRNTMIWHVAVNGVMAGCKPEYMPILIAMTKALGTPEFRRTLASTHGWIPYSWLNGPVARQLGISSGQGEISEDANLMLGRFMNLALMNLAGYYVGDNRMGTFGYPQPWCMAEDEKACIEIGWQPYHVSKGYGINDNTITLSSSLMWGNNMAPSTTNPHKIMELMAWDIAERCQFALGSGKQYTNRTILMTPSVARNLAKGYKSQEDLEKELIISSRRPLNERVIANYYANPGSNPEEKHPINHWIRHISRCENAENTAPPVWYDTDSETMMTIPTMKAEMTVFLVTGDDSRNKIQTMPGGGYATVKIELPREWDTLTRALGYNPIHEYFNASSIR
ncbi:MAG: hypothetical protein NC248_00070 [Bacteroides sp.]|nr:hypothetical protein [Bacteroides sp.]MCM1391095.1 hypothetical protein [Bacteroides sp.]